MHQKPQLQSAQHVISEKHCAPQFGAEPGDALKNSGTCFGCSVRNITLLHSVLQADTQCVRVDIQGED